MSSRQMRFGSRSLQCCSSVFVIDRGLTSQVHISTLHRQLSVQRYWGDVHHPHGQVATIVGT